MVKTIGVWVSVASLVITLGMSWTHFYTEQKINSTEIKLLKEDKKEDKKLVYELSKNQTRLIGVVNSNTNANTELRKDFRKILDVVSTNQLLIAKIAERTK